MDLRIPHDYLHVLLVLRNDFVSINFKTIIRSISRCLLGRVKGGFLVCARPFLWPFSISLQSVFEGMLKKY